MKYGEKESYEVGEKVEVIRDGPGVIVGISKIGTIAVKLLTGETVLGVPIKNIKPFGGDA